MAILNDSGALCCIRPISLSLLLTHSSAGTVTHAKDKLDTQVYVKLVANSAFNRQLEELSGHYVTLEDFYLRRSVQKVRWRGGFPPSNNTSLYPRYVQAIKINSHSPDAKTSTVVDDTFFILQLCAE